MKRGRPIDDGTLVTKDVNSAVAFCFASSKEVLAGTFRPAASTRQGGSRVGCFIPELGVQGSRLRRIAGARWRPPMPSIRQWWVRMRIVWEDEGKK